ncbi:PorT family protein [Chryseobacterium lactis]|uniref:PorT family protein n=1 Tax=Chryseobacterium lactis TaxID=1241981 RepID=A0A3G6RL10_CHRLC|nr:porin family protein [Chryseobacterium lactis]AZA83535.1 PorT family protein [Chryseobacterium lactis]AZB03919.1 PorT family protein [Chryseobacterium lactis]PNW13171.1 PorT family protein [Chryseobacterium lactis]
MKKQLLSLCIVMGTMALAQSTEKPKFGVKAGANISSITGSDSKSKFGFYAGAFANIPISSVVNIQPEVLYSEQGAKAKDKYYFGGLAVTDMKQTLGYINVPVMVQYNATSKFYLEAGPEFGFLINAKAEENFIGTPLSRDNKDSLRIFNFGLGLGLGYKLMPKLGVNARYIAGLTDIAKYGGGDNSKNTNFQLGLNYSF